jgi:hypothetical protein
VDTDESTQLSKELKQWERSRSPQGDESEDETVHLPRNGLAGPIGEAKSQGAKKAHRRNSSEYSGDWVQ